MDNFSQKYFGKNLEELEYSDISAFFIEEKEESDKIEFKAFDATYGNFNQNLEGVIRGICAFLNSNGGLLIWGAPKGQKNGDKLIFKGALSPVSEFKEKDSLISKISDSITPLPININLKILENNGSFLYIFEIQISNYSPHQFKNNYWARLDGQTKHAPHYLIDALFKKVKYPNIEGYLNFDNFGGYKEELFYLDISILLFNFSELQNEYNLSYRLTCPQAIFEGSLNPELSMCYALEGHQFINKGLINTLHFGAPEITTQKLIFNLYELADNHKNELELFFHFGGKQSPLKQSYYKLDFSPGQIPHTQLFKLIKDKEENILSSEKSRKLGNTKEDLLKEILKR